jgi:hypothetical protein
LVAIGVGITRCVEAGAGAAANPDTPSAVPAATTPSPAAGQDAAGDGSSGAGNATGNEAGAGALPSLSEPSKAVSSHYYYLLSKGKVVTAAHSRFASSSGPTLAKAAASESQKFYVCSLGKGLYSLKDAYSQDFLQAKTSDPSKSSALVSAFADTSPQRARFYLKLDASGQYVFLSALDQDYALGVASGSSTLRLVKLSTSASTSGSASTSASGSTNGSANTNGSSTTNTSTYLGFTLKKVNRANAGTFALVDKALQKMVYFKAGIKYIESDCATAMPSTGYVTYSGTYHIQSKQTRQMLSGPTWNDFVYYWMPYKSGVGFHDATWEKHFGGNAYKTEGSHGCIHLPLATAKRLYSLCSVGDLVVVR